MCRYLDIDLHRDRGIDIHVDNIYYSGSDWFDASTDADKRRWARHAACRTPGTLGCKEKWRFHWFHKKEYRDIGILNLCFITSRHRDHVSLTWHFAVMECAIGGVLTAPPAISARTKKAHKYWSKMESVHTYESYEGNALLWS